MGLESAPFVLSTIRDRSINDQLDDKKMIGKIAFCIYCLAICIYHYQQFIKTMQVLA